MMLPWKVAAILPLFTDFIACVAYGMLVFHERIQTTGLDFRVRESHHHPAERSESEGIVSGLFNFVFAVHIVIDLLHHLLAQILPFPR